MASMTLLEMVQDILSDMDSDEVTTINETVESAQVAGIIKSTYFNIIDGRDWPHLYQFIQLDDATVPLPTHMRLPTSAIEVEYIKYNIRSVSDTFDRMVEMKYQTPTEFMKMVDARHSDATNVTSVTDATGVKINVWNDKPPTHYTSFDNEYIVLDAFDNGVETFLKKIKTQSRGKVYPTWTASDSFVADLPLNSFSYFLNESKSIAFATIKQSPNQKVEQHSITQRRKMSQESWRVKNGITIPNYGRNSGAAKVRNR